MSKWLFRGTTVDWQGNSVSQNNSLTSTSLNIFIAYLFAKECRKLGKPVILVISRRTVAGNIVKRNGRGIYEAEEVLGISPINVFPLAEKQISLGDFEKAMDELNIDINQFVKQEGFLYSVRKVQDEIVKILVE